MPAIRAHGALPHKATCMILNLVARVERSDTQETTADPPLTKKPTLRSAFS